MAKVRRPASGSQGAKGAFTRVDFKGGPHDGRQIRVYADLWDDPYVIDGVSYRLRWQANPSKAKSAPAMVPTYEYEEAA